MGIIEGTTIGLIKGDTRSLDYSYMSSVFLVVEPSKIIFLTKSTIPQKEDIILLYNGYHCIPK